MDEDDETNLNKFLDIAEKNETKCQRTPIFDVILDSRREKNPFILNGDFTINDGEAFQVIRFHKNSDQVMKSIKKMIDKKMNI